MKTVIAVLSGLGIATLVAAGTLWIHSWSVAQRSREICGFLWEAQDRVEADVAQGFNVRPEITLPLVLTHLEGTTQHRCADLYAYSGAASGFALMFSALAVVAWRHKKLPDAEREAVQQAVPSRPEVHGRQTKRKAATRGLWGIREKRPVSTR